MSKKVNKDNKSQGIQRLRRGELPSTFGVDGNSLSAVESLGWQEVNMDTGEVLQSVPTAMHPIPQVGQVDGPVDVGDPLFIPLSKPSDLKNRVMAIVGAKNLSEVFSPIQDDMDDEEAFNKFVSDDSDEVDDFNSAMDNLPSSCDENGVSNFEKQLKLKSEEANQLKDYMAQMKDPRIQEFLKLSEDAQNQLLQSLKVDVPPTHNEGE